MTFVGCLATAQETGFHLREVKEKAQAAVQPQEKEAVQALLKVAKEDQVRQIFQSGQSDLLPYKNLPNCNSIASGEGSGSG